MIGCIHPELKNIKIKRKTIGRKSLKTKFTVSINDFKLTLTANSLKECQKSIERYIGSK